MKHVTFLYSDKNRYKSAVSTADKKRYKSQLIQLFTGVVNPKKIQKILDDLHVNFPHAIIVGTTTAGEISHAKMFSDETVVSLSLFEDTKLKVSYIESTDEKSGKKLYKKVSNKNIKATIIFSEGLNGQDYEGFIQAFQKQNPKVIIAGGLAGDNFNLKQTFIFFNNLVYKKGSVAISFSGKNLFADNRYNLNWTPIGKEFTITSARKNIIDKIDNENAVDIFKKYLGSKIFENNSLSSFQLLYKDGSTIVSRTPMQVIGDSIVFAGPLKDGQKVQFGFSNASTVVSGSTKISELISKKSLEAIFIYSCIARKTLLGKVLEKEFSSFEEIAPTAGFFTYGEYYSTNSNNALLNCTTTLLVMSERSKSKGRKIKVGKLDSSSLDNVTFDALTHFIKQTSSELDSNIKLLNQYKSVVDEASLVSKTDKKGIITYVNDNFCNISKYSRDELIGKNHNIVRDENVSSFIFKKMWNTIESGQVWRGKFSNKTKNGSIYYVDATIMPIFNEDNDIQEFIAIRQDITKQIVTNNRIKEKEKFIKAIFDNQDNIVIYTSKDKGMQNANQKLFYYLDFKNFEDFKAQYNCICDLFINEEDYVHPDKDENWLETISSSDRIDYKAKFLTKDKEIRIFNLRVTKVDKEFIINLSDITTLENALLKAYSSEQAKSMFLANMSHEIRTPLNGILGFTDILAKKDLQSDTKKYIDIIHNSGQTLLNVVNDILDFSKIESGELAIYESESNLFSEMEATVAIFASVSKNKRLNYYTYIDTEIPKALKCDVQRIKQVLSNLISNAIKFTPENGTVDVRITLQRVEDTTAKIKFSVKDSGIGIDDKKLSTIFQAFLQADNSISREFGGTGLGLAISSKYIQMMGQNIEVKSQKDKGSEFYFTLDLDIMNFSHGFEKHFDMANINIDILDPKTEISCAINEIILTYLNAWQCSYRKIDNIGDVTSSTDILIVCANLFDEGNCISSLDRYEKLQLLYIEGATENFYCNHSKFHLVEQPMTGSLLFDNIISLSHKNTLEEKINDFVQESEQQYRGKILVAEDNETNQMLISIMLEERGVEYLITTNGQEAVDEALSKDYDLIFMDINMPILDGVSATKILREKKYLKPIVSLSANVIITDIEEFKAAGVDDTLNKPIVPSELDAILDKYLNNEKKVSIVYDKVNILEISKALSLSDTKIVTKLLKSFNSTIKVILKSLNTDGINKELLHNIKGMSGNLRFNEIYRLVGEYESDIEGWNTDLKEVKQELLVSHLKNLIIKIDEVLDN